MAVAAADFYTYARATGTPLPKTKQEEAQLTPAVDKWKRSRTKAPQQQEDSNAVRNVLGTGAVAAGLAGAAAYGYRRGWGKAADVAADVGKEGATSNIVRNLPNVDNVTGLADTTFIPSPITPQDSRGVKLVGTKNKQTGTYRASVNEIQKEPQVQTEFQNQAAAERDWNLAYARARQEGLADADAVIRAKEVVGQPIRKDYTPGPETEIRKGLSKLKLSSPISPRSYIEKTGAIEPNTKQYDYQAGPMPPKIDPDDVVEQADGINYFNPWAADQEDIIREQAVDIASGKISGGTPYKDRDPVSGYRYEDIQNKLLSQAEAKKEIPLAPSPKQFSENQLIELNQYASSVADYDGNPDFIRINDKLDNYLEGRTNVYPLTQEDIQKFNESLTDLKKVDPGAFDDQLDQLSSDVSVSLGREAKEQTLVAQQKTIGPELTEQTLESANSGYEQMDDAFDRSVQRDTDSIAVGSQAVEVEKTQQALLQEAKLKAAAAIENRRIQLEQNTNLDPRSTRFDNALAKGWATKPNVDPSIGSEDFRKTVQAPKDVEDFISTEIPETDASNVARNYYNEDTGNIQFATEDGGSPLIRDIYKEKVLPSEDVSKAASGGTIRGQSRSLDIQEPQRRTRTDEFTGDISPDTPGGLTGFPRGPRPRGVQLSNEASPALPLNQRAPRTQVKSLLEGEVERIDDYISRI